MCLFEKGNRIAGDQDPDLLSRKEGGGNLERRVLA
jgi:hypothetical protein